MSAKAQAMIGRFADVRFIRYLLASIGALAVDMGSFLILLAVGCAAAPASAAASRECSDNAYSGLIDGKRMTSRIAGESVSSMIRRSMPMPQPPVGGRPYSSARMKSAS
mgnify:CR=1 FL=1